MKKYYFLCTAFPVLKISNKPELSFEDLSNLLYLNLSNWDREKLRILKMYIDIKNMKNFWKDRPIDPKGNLDKNGLNEAFLLETFFPSFVFDFLKKYKNKEEREKNFSLLLYNFFTFFQKSKNPFLRYFFTLEKEISLILTALRAKEAKRDILKEGFIKDKKDFFINFILMQKDQKTLDVPKKYERVKEIFLKNNKNPKNMHFEMIKFKIKKYLNFGENCSFTISEVLAYVSSFFILDDFYALNKSFGKKMVEEIL